MQTLSLATYHEQIKALFLKKEPFTLVCLHPVQEERSILFSHIRKLVSRCSLVSPLYHTFEQIQDQLLPSIFNEAQDLLIVDRLELLKADQVKKVVANLDRSRTVFLGSSKKIDLPSQCYLLDFSVEKPWERKKRWEADFVAKCKNAGLFFPYSELRELVEKYEGAFFLLEGEFEKILLSKSLKLIVPPEDSSTFEIAFSWIIESKWKAQEIDFVGNSEQFFSFIGQLRFQIYRVLKYLENPDLGAEQLSLRKEGFLRFKQGVQGKDRSYYISLLQTLFHLELKAKTEGGQAFFPLAILLFLVQLR